MLRKCGVVLRNPRKFPARFAKVLFTEIYVYIAKLVIVPERTSFVLRNENPVAVTVNFSQPSQLFTELAADGFVIFIRFIVHNNVPAPATAVGAFVGNTPEFFKIRRVNILHTITSIQASGKTARMRRPSRQFRLLRRRSHCEAWRRSSPDLLPKARRL